MEEVEDNRTAYERATGRRAFRAQESTWKQVWQAVNAANGWPDNRTYQGFPAWDETPESTMAGWKVLSQESDRFADYMSDLNPLIDAGLMVEIETPEELTSLKPEPEEP